MQDDRKTITNEDVLVCDLVAANYFNKCIEDFTEQKSCEKSLTVYYKCNEGSLIVHAKDASFLFAESFVDYDSHLNIFCSGLRSAKN